MIIWWFIHWHPNYWLVQIWKSKKKVFSRKAVTQRLYYYHRPPPLCRVKCQSPPTDPFDIVSLASRIVWSHNLHQQWYDCSNCILIVQTCRLPWMSLQFIGLQKKCFGMQYLLVSSNCVKKRKFLQQIVKALSDCFKMLQPYTVQIQLSPTWQDYTLIANCQLLWPNQRELCLICGIESE